MIVRTIALALLAVILAGCQEEEPEAPPPPRPVVSEVLSQRPAEDARFVGTVASRSETDLAFQVVGRVAERPVDVGDIVSEGEVVARLDTDELAAAERSAKANLDQAEARLRTATDAAARTRELFSRNVSSEAEVENAEQQLAVAQSSADQARAALAQASDQVANATLKASADGVVTATYVSAGATVSAGEPVLKVARTDRLEAIIDLPQAAIAALAPDTGFKVWLDGAPRLSAKGTLAYVEPVAEAATRTRRLHIALIDPPPAFRLGALIAADLEDGDALFLSLPEEAIVREGDAARVWRVDRPQGTVEAVTVETGPIFAGRTRILGGLEAGDEVVVRGVHSLEDGETVGERIAP